MRSLVPRRSDYSGLRSSWRRDVVAGVSVGVVALPLALAFGVTAGVGAAAGVMTAIVAGVVAAVLGGSSVQVTGPTGAMTVVLVPIVARFGADAVLAVGMVAGVLIVLAAVARVGRFLEYVPWPVIEGFTVGIACIILLQQVPAALGVVKPEGENAGLVAVKAIGELASANAMAVLLVGVVVLVMLVVPRLHRGIPASLVAVVAATALAQVAHLEVDRIGALPSSLPAPSLPAWPEIPLGELFTAAFAVAVLGALESLLSARVADGMGDQPRHDADRELFGQGWANLVSPLFGGMPATGAIARTAVNVRAGAHTRVAAIVHSAVLVLIVYLAGSIVAQIPLAALAGVLMVTAVRMIEPHNAVRVLRSTRSDAVVFVATAVATVAFDLIVAVEIGIAASAVLALRTIARSSGPTEVAVPALPPMLARASTGGDTETEPTPATRELLSQNILVYQLDGALFFGAAQRFLSDLVDIADVDVVVLRFPGLSLVDATGAQALGNVVAELERRHITVLLVGARPDHLSTLRAVGVLDELAHEHHLFTDEHAALVHARVHVERAHRSPSDQARHSSHHHPVAAAGATT